jgi:hypothetical protein
MKLSKKMDKELKSLMTNLMEKRGKLKSDMEAMDAEINRIISSPESYLFKEYKKKYSNTFWKLSYTDGESEEGEPIRIKEFYRIKDVVAILLDDCSGKIIIRARYNGWRVSSDTGEVEFSLDNVDWGLKSLIGYTNITKAEYEKEKAGFLKRVQML